jgi:hypothetical protein
MQPLKSKKQAFAGFCLPGHAEETSACKTGWQKPLFHVKIGIFEKG